MRPDRPGWPGASHRSPADSQLPITCSSDPQLSAGQDVGQRDGVTASDPQVARDTRPIDVTPTVPTLAAYREGNGWQPDYPGGGVRGLRAWCPGDKTFHWAE